MQYSFSLATILLLVSSTIGAPTSTPTAASPSPTPTKASYSYRLQAKTVSFNPNIDKYINNLYVTISTGPNSPDAVLTSDTTVAPKFKFIRSDTSIQFNNDRSLILTGAVGGEGITQFTPGAHHNGIKPYPIRGGHCFTGTAKNFDSFLGCQSQYGPYLAWADRTFNLTAYNEGRTFQCTAIALCQDLVV